LNATARTGREPSLPGVQNRTIGPICRQDREPLHRLLVDTGYFTPEEIVIALELIDAVLDKPGQKDYEISVCRSGDTVLGYYCIGPTPATDGTWDLYWIAVAPPAQGKGVGGALLAEAEELIRSRQGRLVMVETSSQPRYDNTRAFYLRCGYQELARIKAYYRPGDDLVIFGKYLSHP
jgi:ribosomal protein S18 acetylase RimI-like enzyme